MPAGQPASAEGIREIVEAHRGLEGPLLPILHSMQAAFGCIPQEALPVVAEALNISRAEVHGVMSFYHDFRTVPAGRHIVRLCRSEACQAVGADAVAEAALDRLGLDWHGTTPDGSVTVEPVFCLGLCACGPAAMVDDRLRGRLDEERMREILEGLGA